MFLIFFRQVCHTILLLKFSTLIQSNCRQTTKKFVPARSMWLNSIFSELANTDE